MWWWLALPLTLAALALIGVVYPPPRDSAPPRRHLVEIRGMAFHPAVLEVSRGDTVVWTNRDFVPHTATAAALPLWSTGTLVQNQSGQFLAGRAGTIQYLCELHPVMQGTLIVR